MRPKIEFSNISKQSELVELPAGCLSNIILLLHFIPNLSKMILLISEIIRPGLEVMMLFQFLSEKMFDLVSLFCQYNTFSSSLRIIIIDIMISKLLAGYEEIFVPLMYDDIDDIPKY